jgi:hypothetical protein
MSALGHRRVRALAVGAVLLLPTQLWAQVDSTRRPPRDSTSIQGSIYNRPFIVATNRIAIGGYIEGNSNYLVEDGLTDGFSFELRRFNIFLFAPIGARLRFFSELEFEHGTQVIGIETAQFDLQINPALSLRMGIVLPPLGAFNQNHDSPRWDFIDRPLVSTRIIPSTLAEAGAGVYGRLRAGARTSVTYDAYLTNGLGDGILDNEDGRTSLPAGKRAEQFADDNNGSPALSGRLGVQRRGFGEVGFSYYGAIYNRNRIEGVSVDDARRVHIAAIDLTTAIGRLSVRGEAVRVALRVPPGLGELFAQRQQGAHLDLVLPVVRRRLLGFPNTTVSVGLRAEYVDFNVGRFSSTGAPIRDDIVAWVPGITVKPNANTVLKANYRRHATRDLLGNPTARLGGYQLGFATYF